MRLALSSAAAPGWSFDALLDACMRRGLSGLELVEGHAHGVSATGSASEFAALRRRAAEEGVAIVAFRLASAATVDRVCSRRISESLGAPVFRPSAGLSRALHSAPDGASCWQAEPALGDLTTRIAPTLRSAGSSLVCVRLCGAGPESAQWSGRGIGSLMVSLTLSGFSGSLVLAPSGAATLPVWRTWLGRSKGWGCGSRNADPDLVQLSSIA